MPGELKSADTRRIAEDNLVKVERDESFLGTTKYEQVRKADCQK